MFPTAYASVYYNEAGEPLGWDNTYYDEPEYHECCGATGRCRCDDDYDDDQVGSGNDYDDDL